MAKPRSRPKKTDPELAVDSNRQKVGKGLEVGESETAGQTPTPKTGELVPQAHGGALRWGGTNKGGGHSPEDIKRSFRKLIAEKGLPWVERMLDAPETVECPKCGTKVQPPVKDGVRARLLDTATRLLPQQVEHQGVVVVVDKDSLSV